ncbi:hypothetical protein [Actinomadura rugatobispora]|uniref:PPM-type phosphatase domain-containing protein n=1 Tax=Actinomadura rugatobispora TaxID=1994 RepID=A0ABW0ZSF5_9ACTN|nr:hypothetical protein GCM10010200_002430 [Actinomadura rugatobispora]
MVKAYRAHRSMTGPGIGIGLLLAGGRTRSWPILGNPRYTGYEVWNKQFKFGREGSALTPATAARLLVASDGLHDLSTYERDARCSQAIGIRFNDNVAIRVAIVSNG